MATNTYRNYTHGDTLTNSINDLDWYIVGVLVSSAVFSHTLVDTSMTLLDAGEPQRNYTCIDNDHPVSALGNLIPALAIMSVLYQEINCTFNRLLQ